MAIFQIHGSELDAHEAILKAGIDAIRTVDGIEVADYDTSDAQAALDKELIIYHITF